MLLLEHRTRGVGMGSFDYLFSFYGLLLGIAVANVAIGFADMWRDCEKISVGDLSSVGGIERPARRNERMDANVARSPACSGEWAADACGRGNFDTLCVRQPRNLPGS